MKKVCSIIPWVELWKPFSKFHPLEQGVGPLSGVSPDTKKMCEKRGWRWYATRVHHLFPEQQGGVGGKADKEDLSEVPVTHFSAPNIGEIWEIT